MAGIAQGDAPRRAGDELGALRAELDRLDCELLDALSARLDCCGRIAQHKREHRVPMMQPHRIGVVQQRAARYADVSGLDRTFLRRLYELIIEEACRVEDLIINQAEAV